MSTNLTHRLIGLDPGLRFTGWGVIDVTGPKLVHVASGSIASRQADALPTRLLQIENGLEKVFNAWAPGHAGVEQTFVNRDGAATLKLGQARAVCLLVPARRDIPVHEYAPNFIKRAVTGSGHAAKEQIAAMIRVLLPQSRPADEHAADALAVAVTLAHAGDLGGRLAQALEVGK